MERKSIMVTGSTGLLGIAVVRALLAKGYRVLALARDLGKASRVLPQSPDLEVIEGAIEAWADWERRLEECEGLMHGAAYFRETFGHGRHAESLRRLNVEVPCELARAADRAGCRRAVIVSSSLVISKGGPEIADEGASADGATRMSPYGLSKVAMERALAEVEPELSLDLIVVRPGWLFGPDDHAPTAAGAMCRELAAGRTVAFPAAPPLAIADSRDVAAAIAEAFAREASGGIYNLSGRMIRPQDALAEVARAAGRGRVSLVPVPAALFLATILEPLFGLFGKDSPIPKSGIATLAAGRTISSARAEAELGASWRPFAETAADCAQFALSQARNGTARAGR
jgi:dihydroflavonol-4-reductase